MEEIKVGEYVRTTDGFIGKKIKDGLRKNTIELEDNVVSWITDKSIIVKHSKNIINLIEVGDYVNGLKVTGIMSGYVYLDKINIETGKVKTLADYQINSIVTKEQFSSVEYRLEE